MDRFDEELFEASLCIESDNWTKETLSDLPTGKGILLFTDASGRPIQLLQAANLRRTAQAKLVRDEESAGYRKADISGLTAAIFYTCCHNHFESQLAYIRLTHAVFPEAAADLIQLPKTSLAAIEMDADLPFFYVSDNPQMRENRKVFGLFPTRKTVAEFCEILNTVFNLCRNPSLLNTGREASCPYLQMETCPGPCLNADCRNNYYSNAVRQACLVAAGQIEHAIRQFTDQMNQAAQSMQFEKAAVCKKQIERLNRLTGNDFCWVHDLQYLCILHVDVGSKRKVAGKNKKQQLYKAWKITAEDVYELGAFVPKTSRQVTSFLNRTWNTGQKLIDTPKTKEHIAVLSLGLFRSNPSGLWLDGTNEIPETVKDLITGEQYFSR